LESIKIIELEKARSWAAADGGMGMMAMMVDPGCIASIMG
jgi:hypothetical protein